MKILKKIFPNFANTMFFLGVSDGYKSCESLVIERIKKNYPENSKEMIEKLLK